jgi:hypothetical protein
MSASFMYLFAAAGLRLPGEALALASHPDHHLDRKRTSRIRGGERDSFSEAVVHDDDPSQARPHR